MVDAARKHNRVVQVGTHRRSSRLYADLVSRVTGGALGKVTVARTYRLSNMFPEGIGKAPPSDPPAGTNWDMWLGPAARTVSSHDRPVQVSLVGRVLLADRHLGRALPRRHPLGTAEEAPASISDGGRFAIDDDRTIPDTLEAVFEFASGRLAVFGNRRGDTAIPRFAAAKLNFAARSAPPTPRKRSFEPSSPSDPDSFKRRYLARRRSA